MNIRTWTELEAKLNQEYTWRLQEISEIKTSVKASSGNKRDTFMRAGVALLYAHWEGFIKISSEAYLSFVANQRLCCSNLSTPFVAHALKYDTKIGSCPMSHAEVMKAVDYMRSSAGVRARFGHNGIVNTRSNLRADVFSEIANSVNVSSVPYETKFPIINTRLVDYRNHIAHGKFMKIDAEAYVELSDNVVLLINMYKNDIENAAITKSFCI